MSEIEIKRRIQSRKLYWQNYAARIIAGLWAGFWIFFALSHIVGIGITAADLMIVAGFTFVFLASALIPWRWEMSGGILLLVEGMIIGIFYPIMVRDNFSIQTIIFIELTLALPPVLAGFLFVIHKKIQMRHIPQNSPG